MDLVQFLGRFHVLILHLPIGILVMAACIEIYTVIKKQKRSPVMQTVWLWGMLSAVVTCMLGYMLSLGGGYDPDAVSLHRNWGIGVVVSSAFCWLYFAKIGHLAKRRIIVLSVIQLFILSSTGHYGANMTHGPTFLVEHAPQVIRDIAGLPERKAKREKPLSVLEADIYQDVISPLLEQRCSNCHNAQKAKGKLQLDSYAGIVKGGKSGSAVVANSLNESELYQRITLNEYHDDFMPAEGKTPLSTGQVNIVKWWIENGALDAGLIKDLPLDEETNAALSEQLGLITKVLVAEVSAETVIALEQEGFHLSRIMQGKPWINAIYETPQVPLTDAKLDLLSSIKEQLLWLKLNRSSITDEQMQKLAPLTQLQRLNIANTTVSNAGLTHINGLLKLKSLNVFNTKVSKNDSAIANAPAKLNVVYGDAAE